MPPDVIHINTSITMETHPSFPSSADLDLGLASVLLGYVTIHLVSWSLSLVTCIMGVTITISQDCDKDGNNRN